MAGGANTALVQELLQSKNKESVFAVRHLAFKRLFDLAFSLFVVIVGAPIFFLIALAILCTSKGAPLYSHVRIGRGGKPFRCYKFRTMYRDADARLKDLIEGNPKLKSEWEKRHKLCNDPRVTALGAWLRRASLDELPQFINVIKGDLSVVGPRPVVAEELKAHYGLSALKVLSVRPGITGVWQVSGRNNTSYPTRVALDEQYVDTRSFRLDCTLIAKTVRIIFFPRGAY